MAKQRKTYRRIKDSSPTLARVEASEVARALGATPTGSSSAGGWRYPSFAALQQQLQAELVSEGGRPRRAGAVVTRRVPLTTEEARSLDSLTAGVREGGLNVTSGQVAGVLLRERLGAAKEQGTGPASSSEMPDPFEHMERVFDEILESVAHAREMLRKARSAR